jgi:ATP-dependent DNA ligase
MPALISWFGSALPKTGLGFSDLNWVCELKSNGYRLLAHKPWEWATIYSRARQDLAVTFPRSLTSLDVRLSTIAPQLTHACIIDTDQLPERSW